MEIKTTMLNLNAADVPEGEDGRQRLLSAEQLNNIPMPSDGAVIVTENAEGRLYVLSAERLDDILSDWNGDCSFVPANDARVFFAAWNNKPVDPNSYTDFESLLAFLKKKIISD